MKTQKVWFVTGASKGFGLEITKAALAAGDQVVATVRSKSKQLGAALDNHPALFIVEMDVTNDCPGANRCAAGHRSFWSIGRGGQ